MKSKVIIGKYFCFVDRKYKNTIAIQDTTQGISRDLFRWDRRFATPRGTNKNKLNVPNDVVIQAFNTLDVEGLGVGKIDSPVGSRSARNVTTNKVDNNNSNTDVMMKLMIQQAKINSERFNSMQDRINQLSEENIMLMQIVSNDVGKSSPKVEVDEYSNVEFDVPTITEEEVVNFEESLEEVAFIPDDEEELPPRRKAKVDADTDTVAAGVSDEIPLSSRTRNRSRKRKSLNTPYEKLKE